MTVSTAEAIGSAKFVALYFSAHCKDTTLAALVDTAADKEGQKLARSSLSSPIAPCTTLLRFSVGTRRVPAMPRIHARFFRVVQGTRR